MAGAVADQRDHRAIRAGDGGAHRVGQALADGAAGQRDQVVAGRAGGHGAQHQARGDGFVDEDGALRQQVAHGLAHLGRGEFAAWAAGALRRAAGGLGLRGAQRVASLSRLAGGVLLRRGQGVHGAGVGHQVAFLAGIGEERHRRLASTSIRCSMSASCTPGQLGQVGDALHRGRPAPRSSRVGKPSASSLTPLRGNARGGQQAGFAQRPAAQQQRGLPPERMACAMAATVVVVPAAGAGRGGGGQGTPPSPHDTSAGRISVATWPGRPRAAAMASAASWPSSAVALRGAHEAGRHVARHGFDVRLQLGVVLARGRWRGRRRC
jgi:hypothetical protein